MELYGVAASGRPIAESLILNYAILAYHFRRWRIPFSHLLTSLQNHEQGPLGIRGKLISIQNRHRPSSNSDDFSLPLENFSPIALSDTILAWSDTLRSIHDESIAIEQDRGFVRQLLPISRPVDPSVLAISRIASQAMAENGRRLMYPQYEHTALLFMSLTGIEFLIRSRCPTTCTADMSLPDIIELHTSIPLPIRDRLSEICSTRRLNLRNRCMHGAFLEIEGRREDLIRSSGSLQEYNVPLVDLSSDGTLAKNACSLVLKALADAAPYLEVSSSALDTAWTNHFLLTPTELAEADAIYCEFDESLETAETWRIKIRDYFLQVTPALSTPLKLGMVSWRLHGPPLDALSGFHLLVLLFEPFLRLNLHLAGKTVLNRPMAGDPIGQVYEIKYLMLDSSGLLAPDIIDWLVHHLEDGDKAIARRVLYFAVKCRDAFAHGAVYNFTEDTRRIYGHMIVKAIQLVLEAGARTLDEIRAQQTANNTP